MDAGIWHLPVDLNKWEKGVVSFLGPQKFGFKPIMWATEEAGEGGNEKQEPMK